MIRIAGAAGYAGLSCPLARMTRDVATNSTFKDRVPLAGKGVRWTNSSPWWRLMLEFKKITAWCQH